MKKIILSATALSGLVLAGCIPIDSDKVGVTFDFKTEAEAVLKNVTADKLDAIVGNDEGLSFDAGFDPTKTKFSAEKSTVVGLGGADINSRITAVSNGTSRIKNNSVWDRVQNHPITVDMDVKVKLSLEDATSGNFDAAVIDKANLSIQGEFGTDSVDDFEDYQSDKNNKLKGKKSTELSSSDFIPDGGKINAVISDVSLKDYAINLITPKKKIKNEELYGAYRNNDQYTAFFAAGSDGTDADQVKDKTTANEYKINFRGIANWSDTEYKKLSGTGRLKVNFAAGTYNGDIIVRNGDDQIGDIEFIGSSTTSAVSFSDNAATYKPDGKDPVKGYVEGSAYGNDAATFMGTADFADGEDVLVGAFNAVAE